MIEAWRDACVMGTEHKKNEQINGDYDISQQDAASVSIDTVYPHHSVIFIAFLWLKLYSILNPSVAF